MSVRVIQASAGSGKTFELTTQFLALLDRGVAPERILASTFTRKAAGEILERIFGRLAGAAAGEDGRGELDRELGRAHSRAEYLALLGACARSIQRFRVQTLDAFFVQLAQSFRGELGLGPSWAIADEVLAARARGDALGRVLADKPATQWSVLLRELARTASGRRVHATLLGTIGVGQALARESAAGAWDRIATPAALGEDDVARALDEIVKLELPRKKDGSHYVHWVNSIAKIARCSPDERWEDLCDGGLPAAVAERSLTFSSQPIDDTVRAAVARIVLHAAACIAAGIAAQNRAARRLLDDFEREYGVTQRQLGLLCFEDLPHVLARGPNGIARAERLDEIALRLGGRIDHLLLDEFQDTSPAQWRVLEPWVDDLVARGEDGTLLCVGDSKQSIYGWRAADPRLLEGLPERFGIDATALNQSRRSSQVVLDAVNQLFGQLHESPALAGDGKRAAAREAAKQFVDNFAAHVAHDRRKLGEVRVHTSAAADRADEQVRAALARAIELAGDIRERAPNASIAILLRRNRFLPAVVHGLRERGIAASDEGGNQLTDSAAVQAALSLLHLIDHPGDSAALFHVTHTPLAAAVGLERDAAGEWTRRARASIVDRGLARWLEQLAPTIASGWGAWDARRFASLVDLALAPGSHSGLRLDDFIARAREQRVEDPSAALVRVMTVHAAKGLEFDSVIAIELDRALLANAPAFAWSRPDGDPSADIDAVSRSANECVRTVLAFADDSTLDRLLGASQTREMRDEFSGLYVAMTRARHRLDLVIAPEVKGKDPPSSGKKLPLTLASIVRSAYGLGAGALAPETVVWTAPGSDDAWAERSTRNTSDMRVRPADAGPRPLTFAPSRRPRELERVRPSRIAPAVLTATSELFAAPSTAARLRGTRWHAWLERVEWLDEFRDTDAELARRARELGLGGGDLELDLHDLRAALERPVLRALLTRGAGELEVWRERRFSQIVELDGGVQLESGAFDRVVVEREGGAVARATVIDFKSDRAADERELAAHVEQYAPQLRAYRRALARILAIEPERIAARLVFVALDAVRDV